MGEDLSKTTLLDLLRWLPRLSWASWAFLLSILGGVFLFGRWSGPDYLTKALSSPITTQIPSTAPVLPQARLDFHSERNPSYSETSPRVLPVPAPTRAGDGWGNSIVPPVETSNRPTSWIRYDHADRVALRLQFGLTVISQAIAGRSLPTLPIGMYAFLNVNEMSRDTPPSGILARETTDFPEVQYRRDGSIVIVGHIRSNDHLRALEMRNGQEISLVPDPNLDDPLVSIPLTKIEKLSRRIISYSPLYVVYDIVFR